jgi:hypothetical protein
MSAVSAPHWTIESLESAAIDAEAFDHEAHIYVGWLYLERYPLTEAIEQFTNALRRLTRKLGASGKYHETISWFYLLLIEERRSVSTPNDWFAFRGANNDLFCRDDNIIERYYSKELISSDRARQSFVLPDRLANPT